MKRAARLAKHVTALAMQLRELATRAIRLCLTGSYRSNRNSPADAPASLRTRAQGAVSSDSSEVSARAAGYDTVLGVE